MQQAAIGFQMESPVSPCSAKHLRPLGERPRVRPRAAHQLGVASIIRYLRTVSRSAAVVGEGEVHRSFARHAQHPLGNVVELAGARIDRSGLCEQESYEPVAHVASRGRVRQQPGACAEDVHCGFVMRWSSSDQKIFVLDSAPIVPPLMRLLAVR